MIKYILHMMTYNIAHNIFEWMFDSRGRSLKHLDAQEMQETWVHDNT